MSGASIARTLDGAFKTVGAVMGYPFKVYRPLDWVQPVSDENYLYTLNVAASPDDAFTQDPDDLAKFKLYCKATQLEERDILVCEALNRTYVVLHKMELRVAQGVLANDTIKILRPELAAGAMGFAEIARKVPAAVKISGSGSAPGAMAGVSSSMASGQHELSIWCSLPADFIRLNDTVEVNNTNRYLVTFCQSTAQGTFLKVKSTKVGK